MPRPLLYNARLGRLLPANDGGTAMHWGLGMLGRIAGTDFYKWLDSLFRRHLSVIGAAAAHGGHKNASDAMVHDNMREGAMSDQKVLLLHCQTASCCLPLEQRSKPYPSFATQASGPRFNNPLHFTTAEEWFLSKAYLVI